jgi:hypothetical protein
MTLLLRHPWLLGALLILSLLLARPALGCACCDGRSMIEVIGWSKAGNELLMRNEEQRLCNRRIKFEVHGVGSSAPGGCYDLLANPEQLVACDAVTASWEGTAKSSSQTQAYSQLPKSLAAAELAGSYSVSLTEGFRKATLSLWWLGAGEPQRLAQLEVHEYTDWPPSGAPAILLPLEFAVLPVPGSASGKAALLVRGMDDSPGFGHRGWSLQWLDLPAKTTAGATAGVNWVRALPLFSSPPSDIDPPQTEQENSAGLAQLRKGQHSRAQAHFESAVALTPAHALARYNLACALALGGQTHAAMFQLVELLTKAPADVVAERKLRAASDPDLASLRDDALFQRLVCAGPCPELRAAPVSPSASSSPGGQSPGASSTLSQSPGATAVPADKTAPPPGSQQALPAEANVNAPSAVPPGPRGGVCAYRQLARRGSAWLWLFALCAVAALARQRSAISSRDSA